MKTIKIYVSCLLFTAMIANASYAQDNGSPRPLTDKTVSGNLSKDWSQRNPGTQNPSVQWYDVGNGYYGTYTSGTTPYIAFYDKDGGYVQTYKKGEWSSVHAALKSSYDVSAYKNQEVTAYWESSDPAQKAYYLELKDDKGKTSRVWANEKGELSPVFPKANPNVNRPN